MLTCEIYELTPLRSGDALATQVLLNSINIPDIFIKTSLWQCHAICFPSLPQSLPLLYAELLAGAPSRLVDRCLCFDGIYELCQSNVKLWINFYYCDEAANPSPHMFSFELLSKLSRINIFIR